MSRDRYIVAITIFSCIAFLIFHCTWPYDPEKQPFPGTETTSQSTASGILYSINLGQQTCNPSISPDMVNYPGCMLWLNFYGQLVVDTVNISGYTTDSVDQHDRITITDTGNNVRWYIMREELGITGITGQIQDPEWSTHPDYIACLGAETPDSAAWDGYAVRISDKAYLKFCEEQLISKSTPHLWLPDTVSSDSIVTAPEYDVSTGFVKKQYVAQFFGTSNVKIVYALIKNGLTLYILDYNDSVPKPVQLAKPAGKESWDCESPLISPEGNWVTYNCAPGVTTNSAFMQRLKTGSTPVLISDDAYEPHWWIDPVDPNQSYYIVFVTLTGIKVIDHDYTNPSVEATASAGTTRKRKLKGSAGDVPAHMGLKVEESSAVETITNLPFKGGLSPDGVYLCTGYSYTYMLMLQ